MPKGVYPRRRVGRPAKAAKPAAPAKPVIPAGMSRWAYIDADTEIARLNDERKELYTKRNDLDREVSKALRKLQTYENAINVLDDKVCAYQYTSESDEEVVLQVTGHHAECWAHGFKEVVDELRGLSLQCSKEAFTKSEEADELKRQAEANWETAVKRREQLGKEWDAAQPSAQEEPAK